MTAKTSIIATKGATACIEFSLAELLIICRLWTESLPVLYADGAIFKGT